MIYQNYAFTVPAQKQIRVITDTDVHNEADDPFAVVQALLSPRMDNVGVIAAHYGTDRDADAMELSYRQLETIAHCMNFPAKGLLYHGAARPLADARHPIPSEGAELIIREALKEDDRPLYVLFLGPLTDMASALLMEPRIATRLTVIWIGGGCYPVGGPEFNMGNDIHAVNVVMSSAAAVWQVPKNVYEMMPVSLAELELRVRPCGKIGEYLFDQLNAHAQEPIPANSAFRTGETWVLGDNPAVGLLLYEHRFQFHWQAAPLVDAMGHYLINGMNRPIRVYDAIDSRLILEDLYAKLALFAQKQAEED